MMTEGKGWMLYHGDCVEVLGQMPKHSIGLSVFSPPYSSLYTYSDSDQDMGNSKDETQFFIHFGYLVDELVRVMKPGRIVAVDCQNLPAMKERDGYIGLKDFRGDIIRCFQSSGFIYHSEHVIWKDPLLEATRTKALGLMHKQLCKDSAMCRAGLPQYLLAFRSPGVNTDPIDHEAGLTHFVGDNQPTTGNNLSHERWRRYASPVWMDIRSNNTLNERAARSEKDERHICPMSMDIIERALHLWSKPGDVVMDPFNGIGSTGYCAIKANRKYVGIELKAEYYQCAVNNMKDAENEQTTLFT